MSENKTLIAMSGGVDSSVAAHLMQCRGFTCVGAMMRLFPGTEGDSAADAEAVARRLGIPFHIFDAQTEFRDRVIKPFISCYERGLTPNPCIECNRYLKFGHLLSVARELGCGSIVTGHYARIHFDEASGRYLLRKASDPAKDQSYVLYMLTQQQLARIHFPLGELTKEQARAIALEQGFLNARKRDSQDICFVPDGDHVAFMENFCGKKYAPGAFLDQSGKVVGTHRGAACYTLGQRKGLGLAMGAPVYVCAKDMARNTVTVGPNEALYARTLLADNWNWIPFPELKEPLSVMARSRYNQKEQPATVYPEPEGRARVVFDQPQRAMTPGQAVVLYQGDCVIGGGTIINVY